MTTPIALTTVQKARRFLDTLGYAPPVYASSDEVVRTLVEHVRRHRDDPEVRWQIAELRSALEQGEGGARLPADTCETTDPTALAHELARLQIPAGGAAHAGSLAGPAALGAVAALLLWSSAGLGCDPGTPGSIGGPRGDDDPVECTDTSNVNFAGLIYGADDLQDCEYSTFLEDYVDLDEQTQAGVVSDLCEMTAEDIATYLMNQFGDPDCEDQPWDDDDAYKGVTF